MSFLPDNVLDHLRNVADEPDVGGTRYTIESEIGRGGMGTVYAAQDQVLGRRVALKVLAGADRDAEAAARLLEEARLAARLEHPGIVPVYDAGHLPDGRVFYAMKLVEGRRLDRYCGETESIPTRLRAFQRICEAVAFAHSHGVVHRDLKPENVMVGSFGEVLTMDWGVARSPGSTERAGTVVGTPKYMAPEQAEGRTVDHRADVYSLGAILAFLLPEKAPRRLKAIAAKAMAKEQANRYDGALSISEDVERYLENLQVTAYRENVFERGSRFFARNQTLLLLLLAYVLVRLLLFLLSRRAF